MDVRRRALGHRRHLPRRHDHRRRGRRAVGIGRRRGPGGQHLDRDGRQASSSTGPHRRHQRAAPSGVGERRRHGDARPPTTRSPVSPAPTTRSTAERHRRARARRSPSEGEHTLSYWSVDKAGNEEAHSTITVRIDKSAPTISHTQSPRPNAAGWNNTDVTVTFDVRGPSEPLGYRVVHRAADGRRPTVDHVVTGVAKDNAGNQATDQATREARQDAADDQR